MVEYVPLVQLAESRQGPLERHVVGTITVYFLAGEDTVRISIEG
jgi:hypothetical protein